MVVLARTKQTTARTTKRKSLFPKCVPRGPRQSMQMAPCKQTMMRMDAMEKTAPHGMIARRVVHGTQTARHGHGRIFLWVGYKCANDAHLFFNCTCGWIPLFRFDCRTDSFFHCNVQLIAMYNDRHNDTMTAKARQMNLSIYTCIYGDFSFVDFNRNWAIKGYRGIRTKQD